MTVNVTGGKSYRPRLSGTDIDALIRLIKEKRQILKRRYDAALQDEKDSVFAQIWKWEFKRLLPLLRKFERLDPLNYGYNERWKHKRVPKELARLRMAEGIAKMREEINKSCG
jgi:hypothetical protein